MIYIINGATETTGSFLAGYRGRQGNPFCQGRPRSPVALQSCTKIKRT